MRSELIALLWSKVEFYTRRGRVRGEGDTYICELDREMRWINRGLADSHAYLCNQSHEQNKPTVILTCLISCSMSAQPDLTIAPWTSYLSHGSSAPSQILSRTRQACCTLLFWVSYAWRSLFSYFYGALSYSNQSVHPSTPTSSWYEPASAAL